ncbi:S41 family peptidase [Sphingobacterium sp. ML3W]|uniref:S41 family peptidase n=1 Tax=Sphingobacterium sp. ML3W TaxID=1538644 RepID=UPI00249C2822|nr:S41 family peptidase [Sphingobacterium sp. ML3W]WFA80963.1 S41 family peptidase [Sphingobacterium sp. ML3W]
MRLALAFVFIFMYTINFAQEIVYSSNWVTGIKHQVIPKKRSLVLNNGNIQDSVMYSKYYKLRKVDKGQLTLDIMLKKVRPLSVTPVRFNIAVIGGNKSYNSLYYYSSIPPNKISTKIYIPFDLETDSIAVYFTAAGNFSFSKIEVNAEIQQGKTLEKWEDKFLAKVKDREMVSNLAELAQTWGAIKYNDPSISDKDIDWDEILFDRLYNIFDDIETPKQSIDILLSYASSETNRDSTALKSDSLIWDNLDNSWIKKASLLTSVQKERLQAIVDNPPAFKNKYIDRSDNLVYTKLREKTLHKNVLPNVYERLVNLFRYCNVIKYLYPYKYTLSGQFDSGSILEELIPQFVRATKTLEYNNCLLALNASIKDGHSAIPTLPIEFVHSIYGNFAIGLPMHIKKFKQDFIVTTIDSSFSKKTGIEVGSPIRKINGVPVNDLYKKISYYIGSPRPEVHEYLVNSQRLLSFVPISDSIDIVYATDKIEKNIKIKGDISLSRLFSKLKDNNTTLQKSIEHHGIYNIDDSVTYLNPAHIDTSAAVNALISQSEKIILDLRNYPNGKFDVQSLLPSNVVIAKTQKLSHYPQRLIESDITTTDGSNHRPNRKIVALISEASRSNPEFLAMALRAAQRADDITIIGRNSMGADGNVVKIPLIGSPTFSLWYTGIRILYPDHGETQGIGIKPDVYVPLTEEEVTKGVDNILNNAIDIIRK